MSLCLFEKSFDSCTYVGGGFADVDASGRHRFHLLFGRALATGNDSTRVTHATAGRCCASGDETDDWLVERAGGDVLGCLFFRRAANLSNHDDGIGTIILCE